MRSLTVATAVLVLFAVAFEGQWFPLGVPNEWEWERLGAESQFMPSSWTAFLLCFVLAAILAGAVYRAAERVAHLPRRWYLALIGFVCLIGSVFQLTSEIGSPPGLGKWCLFAGEWADGYYRHVRRSVPTIGDALRGHADFCAAHCYPHLTTNPVGWVVVHRALLNFYEARPELAQRLFHCELAEIGHGYTNLVGVRLPYVDRAALLTLAYGSRLIGCLIGLPVAWLVAMRFGRGPALAAAAASYLVPGSILFAPRSDTVYPTFAALVLALSYRAVKRSSWTSAALAATLVAAGMQFCLCFGVVAGMSAILVAVEFYRQRQVTVWPAAAASIAFVLVVLLLLAFEYDALQVWSWNLENNARILAERSRWLWALVNPLEMAAAMGPPATVFLVFRGLSDVRNRRCDSLFVSWVAMLLLLDVSGASLGEVARLWIFAMPIGVALAVETLDTASRPHRIVVVGFLVLQAVSCILLSRQLVVFGFE
jgi:hypothetical protein